MRDLAVFLTMLGIMFGGVIAWIVYTNISDNMAKNSKNIAKKAEILLKKDMSSKCARCTFYMNNDYNNGYSQSEWMDYYKESTQGLDKNSQEYAEAVAPLINAIVVNEIGYLVRRGMENKVHSLEAFRPGENDRISLNYFVEPYEYVKDEERAKQSQAQSQTREVSPDRSASELREAEKRYRDAVYAHKKYKDSSMATYYEIQEKKAYAALVSAQAKYDNRK